MSILYIVCLPVFLSKYIVNDKVLFYFGVYGAGFWPLKRLFSLQNPDASAGGL